MPICIYCKRTKPSRQFSKEHVLTRAFCGRGQNWTLVNSVCAECNETLAKFEYHWAHSTAEALARSFEGPLGRSARSGEKRPQPFECDQLYMVQGNDERVYEAGLAFPGESYFRPQLVQTDDGLVALVPEREDIGRLDVVDRMVKAGTFEVCRPIGSGRDRTYEVATLALDFDANGCRLISRRTEKGATGYWLRSYPVPPTVRGLDGTPGRLTPRCAVDDRDRLYFRADGWEGLVGLLEDLVRNRNAVGSGPQQDQTVRIGLRPKMPLVFRAVLKTGLNYVARVAGSDVALDETFGGLRRMVLDQGADEAVCRSCRSLEAADGEGEGGGDFPPPSSTTEHRLMLDEFGGNVRFRLRMYGRIGYECVLGRATPRTRKEIGIRRASVDFVGNGIRSVAAWA